MSGIIVSGDTSGSVTLSAPAVAGTVTVTLPSTSGTMAVTGASQSFTNITATGTIQGASTIGVGNATPAASGAGITFPATQSASSDANTLDDYEEGTFTPTWYGSSSGLGTRGSGSYTKIGRFVTVNIVMDNITFITFSGSLFCTLPFTAGGISASQYIGAPMYFYTGTNWNTGSTTAGITPDTTAGNSYMTFNYMLVNGDRQSGVTSSSCTVSGASGTYARFSISYITS